MNQKTLPFSKKSLRQIAKSRYNRRVDSYARAPEWRLFSFAPASNAYSCAAKPRIFSNLHTLEFCASPTHFISITSALFEKRRGYASKASHFGTNPVRSDGTKTCRPDRFQVTGFAPGWQVLSRPELSSNRFLDPQSRHIDFHLQEKSNLFQTGPKSAETQAQPTTFTKVFRHAIPIFRRMIDEARAFSH